jgi:hypothetical protein
VNTAVQVRLSRDAEHASDAVHVPEPGAWPLQGFAYVKYNNSISAASAVERYNSFELPTGSGLRLKASFHALQRTSCPRL